MANLDLEIQQLNQQRDGLKVYKQIQKLTKKATASSTRLPVVQALLDYAEKGSSVPHRSIALSDAVPFLDRTDTAFESILYRLMERPEKDAFEASLDRNNPTIMGDEWRMIGSHSAVAYILSPPIKKKESESISAIALLLVAELLKAGGVAAKSESAGLAHGRERWLELVLQYRKAIKDGDAHAASAALYRAWVQRAIHDEDTSSLYSVGMHLLGHRDVEVDDDLKVTDAVKWIDLMGLYLVADKPKRALRAGEGFRLCDSGPRRIIELDNCLRYAEDDFFFNPYGYIRLLESK